ncbi:TPA: hypothetical protein DCX16_06630 [bacterium]|nr:hypothetical protein [bacterium]
MDKETRLEAQLKKGELWGDYEKVKNAAKKLLMWENPSARYRSKNELERYYTDHGPEHSERVIEYLNGLTEGTDLEDKEVFFLICGAWLHDIGMFVGMKKGESYDDTRKFHHLRSAEYVEKLTKIEEIKTIEGGEKLINERILPLPFNVGNELINIKDLCIAHRDDEHFKNLPKEPRVMAGGISIRVRLLSALLRIADECDIDKRRSPFLIYHLYKDLIPFTEYEFWEKNHCIESVVPDPSSRRIGIYVHLGETQEEKWERESIVKEIKEKLERGLEIVDNDFKEHKITVVGVGVKDYKKPDEILEIKTKPPKEFFNFESIRTEIEPVKERKNMMTSEEKIGYIQRFYDGNMPTWLEIVLNLDGNRLQLQSILKYAEKFGKEAKENRTASFIIITGEAGTGKTTLLFRSVYELYNKYKKEFEFLRLISGAPFKEEEIMEHYRKSYKPIYVMVDIYQYHHKEIKEDLINASREFQIKNIPVVIIAAARKNEWENTGGKDGLVFVHYEEIKLNPLHDEEIEGIIRVLENNNSLGRLAKYPTYEEKVREFKEKAKRQLLVAMRMAREEEEGKPFEEKIINEYRNLRKDAEKAGESYLYTCFLFAYGILTPMNLLKNTVGSESLGNFKEDILKPAYNIIITHNEDWMKKFLRPRHSLIAEIIMKNELSDMQVIKEKIGRFIDAIDILKRRERYIAVGLLKRLISNDNINGKELVKDILKKYYQKIKKIKFRALIEKIDIELLRWSLMHYELEEYKESKECLEGVLKIDPKNPSNNYYYALVLSKLYPSPSQEVEEKITDHFKKAYNGGFKDPQLFFVYGNFLRRRDKLKEAIKILKEGKILYPDNEKIRNEYENVQRSIIKGCQKRSPGDIKAIWNNASIYEAKENLPKALECYQRILSVKPNHEAALQKCADILQAQERYEEAVKYLQNYIKIHNKKDVCAAKARNDLAIIIVKTGCNDYEEAERLWKESIDIYPQFAWSYIELGKFYYSLKDFRRAVSYLQKGKVWAEFKSIIEAREKAELILDEIHREIGKDKFEKLLIKIQKDKDY